MNNNMFRVKRLFDLKHLLSSDERVTCLDGSFSCLAIGTSRGRIFCVHIQDGAAVVDFVYENSSNLPIVNLVNVSAFESILALISSKLHLIEKKAGKLLTSSVSVDVVSFALNVNPTVDSPFVLQFAVSTNDKQIIVFTLEDKELTVENKFRIEKNALCLCYSRYCICFATEDSYFVHDLSSNTTRNLFPYDLKTTRPMIIDVDIDEFLLNGMQGLGVFATVSGVSSRPPLVWGSDKVGSFVRRSTKIFVLNSSSIIIFDCFDGIEEVQRISVESGDFIYSLDGTIVFNKFDEFFLLEEIGWHKRAEQLLLENKVEEAVSVAKIALSRSNDPAVALEVKYVTERAALKYFFAGNFMKSRELSLEAEMDPRKYIIPFEKLMPLPSGVTFTFDDPFPDKAVFSEDRFLLFLKNCLIDMRKKELDERICRDLDAVLLRLLAVCGEKVDPCFLKEFTFLYEDNRAWLLENNYNDYLLMTMIYFNEFTEAFKLTEENAGLICDNETLFRYYVESIKRISDKDVALKTLQLLMSIDAEVVFHYASEESLKPYRYQILKWLEIKPKLLIMFLEKWRCAEGSNFDTKLIKLYVNELAFHQTQATSNKGEAHLYRQRLHDLIFTSSNYDVEEIIQELKKHSTFRAELIFVKSKEGDTERYLKELLKVEDFDAAETLCWYLCTKCPKLYGILLKNYIHLSSERPELQLRAEDILKIMKPTTVQDTIDTISDVPEMWSFYLLSVFARKAVLKAQTQHTCDVIKKTVLGCCTKELLHEMHEKSSKTVVVDEQTTCYICGKQVLPDDACFNFHTKLFKHIDCR